MDLPCITRKRLWLENSSGLLRAVLKYCKKKKCISRHKLVLVLVDETQAQALAVYFSFPTCITSHEKMSDTILLQLYSREPRKNKRQEQAVTSWKTCLSTGTHRSFPGFRFKLMSVKQDGHSGREWLGAYLTFQGCQKVTSTTAAALPSTVAPAAYSLSQLCVFLCLSSVVVVVFLLWAEFYTVCQSPERHILEGPVEWDTRSDPSGEQLLPHLPTPLCLSLFISRCLLSFQSLPPALSPPFTLCISLTLSSVFSSFSSGSIDKSPDCRPTLNQSDPLHLVEGYATSVGALSARVGRPRPSDIPQHASQRVCN